MIMQFIQLSVTVYLLNKINNFILENTGSICLQNSRVEEYRFFLAEICI